MINVILGHVNIRNLFYLYKSTVPLPKNDLYNKTVFITSTINLVSTYGVQCGSLH